ncbi:MAG: FGGY-family carbohydrate kinase [Armatimonadota bacterium]|nr:hypothetical protein [bacterium]
MRIRHAIGIDISTQAVTLMLISVSEKDGVPVDLATSSKLIVSSPCAEESCRRDPLVWLNLIRECISELTALAPEIRLVESIGVSATLPGTFPVLNDGTINPHLVSLYDNTDDVGISRSSLDDELGAAESETLNRMAPGNMVIGLAHLVKSCGLDLGGVRKLLLPNTALAYTMLREAGADPDPSRLFADPSQCVISGMYDARTAERVPSGVAQLWSALIPKVSTEHLRSLLTPMQPAWRNVLSLDSTPPVRELLGLPSLRSFSIGAGDSPLGALALMTRPDTVITVRGSTDSPMIIVDTPKGRISPREVVLQYPLPTAIGLTDAPWCAVAPTMRSGRVWDWVRDLGGGIEHDRLEAMAVAALKRRLRAPEDSLEARPLMFYTALGGERAPEWDPNATGIINGLLASHDLGDIALAALEGISRRLRSCIKLTEDRYEMCPPNILLAGGCARNALWNWLTAVHTGKKTYATTFSDASLLGAAMLGYAAEYDGIESDEAVSSRLLALSKLPSVRSLIDRTEVHAPDTELAELEELYAKQVTRTD